MLSFWLFILSLQTEKWWSLRKQEIVFEELQKQILLWLYSKQYRNFIQQIQVMLHAFFIYWFYSRAYEICGQILDASLAIDLQFHLGYYIDSVE